MKGVYLPYWTFDAQADATWTAESGTYYYTNENGKRVQHVRWTPAAGAVSHFFDDDLVPGTVGVRMDLLRKVEPFPTDQLAPYDPAFVRGWTVERYQIDLRRAADTNREQMDQTMYGLCEQQVPGDTHQIGRAHV